MSFLLDTHTLLWAVSDSPALSSKARKTMLNTDNTCLFSNVSLWEITIKYSWGALEIDAPLQDFFMSVSETGFIELPVKKEHLLILKDLPHHHKDPFDRLIVSQAIHENLTIIMKDSIIPNYPVKTLW